jgi:hypothetical protein
MRLTRAALAVTVLAGSAAIAFAASIGTASAAEEGRPLPVSAVGDSAVDGVHDRIFLSDQTAGEIVALDYDGAVTARVPNLPGVLNLTLSDDSLTLYAAVHGTDTIVALATETLTEVARHDLADHIQLGDLALSGDRIWFSYMDAADYDRGKIGSVDSTGTVHEQPSTVARAPDLQMLFTSPRAPGVLIAGESTGSGGATRVFDVSSGELSLISSGTATWTNADFAFVSDTEFIQLASSGSRVRISDYAQTSIPAMGGSRIDVAADGRIAVSTSDVYVYDPQSYELRWWVALPQFVQTLDWEPGGDRVFAVTKESTASGEQRYALFSVREPKAPPTTPPVKGNPTVTLSAPSHAHYYRSLTLTGKITLVPAGTELTVIRKDTASPDGKTIGTVKTAANGSFTFNDIPTSVGTSTYEVVHPAGEYAAASASAQVVVYKPSPALIVTPKYGAVYEYGTTITITAKLGTTHTNRVLEIWADPMDSQPKRLLKKAAVDSKGYLSTTVRLTRNTDIRVWFGGDERYAALNTTHQINTKVRISTKVASGYAKTKKVGSVKYYVYKKSTKRTPRFYVTMTQHPNRVFRVTLQRWSGGKWKAVQSSLVPADNDGLTTLQLKGSYAAGTKLRMRPEYIHTRYGDNTNHPTYGTWTYLTYIK